LLFCTLQIGTVHLDDATVASCLRRCAAKWHNFWAVSLQWFVVAVLSELLLVIRSVVEVVRTNV